MSALLWEDTCPLCSRACWLRRKNGKVWGSRCSLGTLWGEGSLSERREAVFHTLVATDGEPAFLPVKSSGPLPVRLFPLLAKEVGEKTVTAPLGAGEVVLANVWKSGVDLVTLQPCYRKLPSGIPPLWRWLQPFRTPRFGVAVCAHRGDLQMAPENTLAAFQYALEQDVELIELDVHLSRDRELVVFHDTYLERTTDGKGKLHNYTLEELRTFSTTLAPGVPSGEKIPTLREVLELCRGKALLVVEIKNPLEENLGIEEPLCELLRETGMVQQVVLTTRTFEYALRLKECLPEAKVLHLIVAPKQIREALESPLDGISPYWRIVNLAVVRAFHERQKAVLPWTVNKPKVMESLIEWGVDAIITDHIDQLQELLWTTSRIGQWNPVYWKIKGGVLW